MTDLTTDQLIALHNVVEQIKAGRDIGDNIQVGSDTVLLSTFFKTMMDRLAGQLPLELREKYTAHAKSKIHKQNFKDENKEYKKFNLWELSNTPRDFQKALQEHLAGLPPQFQLSELNRVQKKCKFSLLDPQGKKLSPDKMHYGFADLYNFMGYPFGPGIVRSSMQGQNPFYNPIEHPVPNIYSNNVLSYVKRFSPTQKLIDAKEIFDEINSKTGGNWMIGPVDSKILDESNKKKIERMAELLHDVVNRVYSPVTLSHMVYGQERPMKTFEDANFNRMLWELNQVHLIKPINSDMPSVSGVNITDSALEQTRGHRKRKVVKRRARK
jgi:hypothetical protein